MLVNTLYCLLTRFILKFWLNYLDNESLKVYNAGAKLRGPGAGRLLGERDVSMAEQEGRPSAEVNPEEEPQTVEEALRCELEQARQEAAQNRRHTLT